MSRKLTLCFTTMTSLVLASATAMAQDPNAGYPQPAPYGAPPPAGYAAPAPYGAPPPAGYAQPAPGYAAPAPGYAAPPAYGAPAAYAAPAYQPPGFHDHDGFYLRLLIGPGYLYSSASYEGESISVKGVGGTFSIAAGGIVSRNLAIFGEVTGTSISDPTVDEGGDSGTADGYTMTLVGLGPGLAYYLGGNAYLSATLLLSKLSVSADDSDQTAETDWGFGGALAGGKEWWVSDNWGLGIAGQLSLNSIKEKDVDYRWTSIAVSLLFTATYN